MQSPQVDKQKLFGFERIGLLVLTLIVFSVSTSNFFVMNDKPFFYPTAVSIYGIQPILEMVKDTNPFKEELNSMFAKETNTDFFPRFVRAKYSLGCYSGSDNQSLFETAPSDTENGNVEKLSETAADVTAKLAEMQSATIGDNTLTVCSCIDAFAGISGASGVTDANDYDKVFKDRTSANSASMLEAFFDTTKVPVASQDEFVEHVVQFCTISAEPVYTTKYEGSINVRVILYVGQLLLLVSCLFDIANENGKMRNRTIADYVVAAFCTLGLLWSGVAYFIWRMYDTDQNKTENLAYRDGDFTKYADATTDPLSFVFLAVFIVILFFFVMYWAFEALGSTVRSNYAYQIGYLNSEIIVSFGWVCLIVSLALQAKQKNIDTLSTLMILVFSVGIVKVISRTLHDMYNRVCSKLNSDDIKNLQTMSDMDMKVKIMEEPNNAGPKRSFILRRFLRGIGMLRFASFLSILIVSVVLIIHVGVTVDNSMGHNTREGTYFYAVVAFFIYNAVSDIVLEMMPLQFDDEADDGNRGKMMNSQQTDYEKKIEEYGFLYNSSHHHAHTVRYFVLILFLLWLNVQQASLWRHELLHVLNK